MDEIDEIWSIDLFGNFSYWVTKETYDTVKKLLLSPSAEMHSEGVDKSQTGIAFKTLDNAEVVILLSNISNLNYNTKAMREAARDRNKFYKDAELASKKESWEE